MDTGTVVIAILFGLLGGLIGQFIGGLLYIRFYEQVDRFLDKTLGRFL